MKLDIGCGKNCKEGFTGVDAIDFGQQFVLDVTQEFPWADDTIEEVHCSHFIEHLTWPQRVEFFNNLYRAMKPDATCTLIWPHWASMRYYGDPTHKDAMSEFAMYYLSKEWRKDNAPHVGYTCNFEATWGYGLNPAIIPRSVEYQQFAIANYKEAATDIHATLTKRVI